MLTRANLTFGTAYTDTYTGFTGRLRSYTCYEDGSTWCDLAAMNDGAVVEHRTSLNSLVFPKDSAIPGVTGSA